MTRAGQGSQRDSREWRSVTRHDTDSHCVRRIHGGTSTHVEGATGPRYTGLRTARQRFAFVQALPTAVELELVPRLPWAPGLVVAKSTLRFRSKSTFGLCAVRSSTRRD